MEKSNLAHLFIVFMLLTCELDKGSLRYLSYATYSFKVSGKHDWDSPASDAVRGAERFALQVQFSSPSPLDASQTPP